MSKPKVVVWRPMYDQIGHQLFEDAGANLVIVDSTDAQAVMAELPDAQAILGAHAGAHHRRHDGRSA